MAKQQSLHCSFCGRSRDEVKILIAGQEGHICENCVEHAQEIIDTGNFSQCLIKIPRPPVINFR